MKKLLVFSLFALIAQQLYGDETDGTISIQNHTDLGFEIVLRFGESQILKKVLSGSRANGDEYTCTEFSKLAQGLYNITIQRDKPGLLSFLGITRDPRALKKAEDSVKAEESANELVKNYELFWNINLQGEEILIKLTPQTSENDQRYILAQLQKKIIEKEERD